MAITHIGAISNSNYTGSNITSLATTASGVTSGNLLVVVIRGLTVSTVTDTAGNTYVKAGAGVGQEIWYAENIIGHGSNQTTVTWTAGGAFRHIVVIQFSGIATSGSLGAFAANNVASGTTVSCIPSSSGNGEQVCIVSSSIGAAIGSGFSYTPTTFTNVDSTGSITVARKTDTSRVFDGTVSLVGTHADSASGKNIVAAIFLSPASPVRITQFGVELLSLPIATGRISQFGVEIISANVAPVVSTERSYAYIE